MNLVAQIRELGIVPAEDAPAQRALDDLSRKFPEPRSLARELIQRNLLTPYQANQLLTGKGEGLLLGKYLILDRLGEGGMGKVFKARHQKMNRVVALKVIHPSRVTNPVAVERFYREIQAVARLSHQNIVWAFDADHSGSNHYFAMQYLPGVDLSRMVKENGPLDVVKACDYIRQAALGLQHIAEHGMVHRDIKPSNLLIINKTDMQARPDSSGVVATAVQTDLVKIMDLGLTRLGDGEDDDHMSTLTQHNTLMGTPDYIAPEQARNSHLADIRSDIYSLGCTLFFALIGRPPFGGKTAVEKVMKHQMAELQPLEVLRPGIPASLNLVLQRMMAKDPARRYQMPVEIAQVLEPFTRGQFAPAALPVDSEAPTQADDLRQTQSLFQFGETEIQPVVATRSAPRQPAGPFDKWLGLWIAGGATLALIILLLVLRLFLK